MSVWIASFLEFNNSQMGQVRAEHFTTLQLSHIFFKQKTAYEIMPSLVGSEMCIRDRSLPGPFGSY